MNHGKKRVSRKSQKSRKTQKSRKSRPAPKTAKIYSRKSAEKLRKSRASSDMSLTDLQFMAKSKGIAFGGLNKTKLVRKINNYY